MRDIDCGIYVITCLVNGTTYVGQSKRIRLRMRAHCRSLRRNKHYNSYLQAAWGKHGESAFAWNVVISCGEAELTYNEQLWADYLRGRGTRLYNIGRFVDCPARGRPGKPITPEQRAKLIAGARAHIVTAEEHLLRSVAMTGNQNAKGIVRSPETRAKMSAAKKGKVSALRGFVHTLETRARMRAAQLGNTKALGHRHSEESKRKMTEARLGHTVSAETRRKISETKRAQSASKKAG